MEEKINSLIKKLQEASVAYYKYDSPIMSDKEYDDLYDELVRVEEASGIILAGSPTQKVQGYVLDGFKKVEHSKPMLSAAKTKDIKDIKKFLGNNDWYCSGKLDGLTLVVVFENGEFVQGVTRGNGVVGEDVTAACRFIKNLPMKIPYKDKLELRGECVMSWNEFNRINETLDEKYSHPRNLAAGTLRQLDLNVVKERNLSFVVFECVSNIKERKMEELHWLSENGFETVVRMGSDVGDIDTVSYAMTNIVKDHKYPYDGLIFEIDSNSASKKLGRTDHHENCRMALKWKDEVYPTILRDVEWDTSKTGAINPVAIFDEVDLDGALTSRATLHNVSFIEDLKLGIGDEITVFRSNMVIPRVHENLTKSNTLEIPKFCPVCNSPTKVVNNNGSKVLMCTNEDCAGRLLGKWETFVSKKGMNVDGMSESTLDKLLKLGYLTSVFDSLYSLKDYKAELYKIDGFGKKSIDNLLASIEKSKNVDLQHFITAFSIPGIGEGQSKLLVKFFKTFDEFYKVACEDYLFDRIPGIGEVLNRNIHKWVFNNGWQMLDVNERVHFAGERAVAEDQTLTGKTFVVTGSVKHFKNRDELKTKIESLGGKVVGSVSKNTDYLINNDIASTSGKNKKAQDLGIPIVNEEQFLKMIEGE